METLAFAQGVGEAAGSSQGGFMLLLPMYLIIFFIFYIFIIKPQQKKQKEHDAMVSAIKKNDEVVMSGGIHGTIVNVKDKTVIVRIDDNAKIEFEKSSVVLIKKSRQS